MDRIDRAILTALQTDSTATSAGLGEKIGLSPSACHRRIKVLEASGVIDRYVALLSDTALGRRSTVFVAVTLDNQRRETLDGFERALQSCKEVLDGYLMSGESDYLLRVVVASLARDRTTARGFLFIDLSPVRGKGPVAAPVPRLGMSQPANCCTAQKGM